MSESASKQGSAESARGTDRYDRQRRLREIGEDGQERLESSAVVVLGCGALGSTLAELLVRAGVGRVRLLDRDVVELDNLHRQLLYDEDDVRDCMPKAQAAARRLRRINSQVQLTPQVVDVGPHNVTELIEGSDLVLDGTDNVETRYLLNDACVELNMPWIYGGAVGTQGMTMTIVPGKGPCLRCVFPDPPPPGSLGTCDTLGVLNAVPVLVASVQVAQAIKILVGSGDGDGRMVIVDPWDGTYRTVQVPRASDCPACVKRELDFLAGFELTEVTRMCGRNAVQVDPVGDLGISLEQLHDRLGRLGKVRTNGHLVQFWVEGYELVVFADARMIVRGTSDPVIAKRLYHQYVGA